MHPQRPVWPVIALGYAVAVVAITTSPVSWALNRLTVWLYVQWLYTLRLPGSPTPEDFGRALNVLLFAPLGFLLARATRWPWWLATVVCVLASGAIEGVQALWLPGRQAGLGDVAANGIGGLLGVLVGRAGANRTSAETMTEQPVRS